MPDRRIETPSQGPSHGTLQPRFETGEGDLEGASGYSRPELLHVDAVRRDAGMTPGPTRGEASLESVILVDPALLSPPIGTRIKGFEDLPDSSPGENR